MALKWTKTTRHCEAFGYVDPAELEEIGEFGVYHQFQKESLRMQSLDLEWLRDGLTFWPVQRYGFSLCDGRSHGAIVVHVTREIHHGVTLEEALVLRRLPPDEIYEIITKSPNIVFGSETSVRFNCTPGFRLAPEFRLRFC